MGSEDSLGMNMFSAKVSFIWTNTGQFGLLETEMVSNSNLKETSGSDNDLDLMIVVVALMQISPERVRLQTVVIRESMNEHEIHCLGI